MTNDELLYATNETIQQLEEYLKQLLERHRGKVAKAHGAKVLVVDEVEYQHGTVWVSGFVLKKNGEPSVYRYGVVLDDAEFVKGV